MKTTTSTIEDPPSNRASQTVSLFLQQRQ